MTRLKVAKANLLMGCLLKMNKMIFHIVSLIIDGILVLLVTQKYGNDVPLVFIICLTGSIVYSAIGLDLAYEKWRRSRWKNK